MITQKTLLQRQLYSQNQSNSRFSKLIHQIEEKRQAIFVGFFGPIGVSAIFYLYITLEFLEGITVDGVQREDAAQLGEVITVVVWFLAICSIVSQAPSSLQR